MDNTLHTWFIQQRSTGTPISGLLLQEKAKHFTSDEEILATIVGDSTESESVSSDAEDEGEDEKLVSTKEGAQCFKKMLVVD